MRRLAWLKGAYGQTEEAYTLLEEGLLAISEAPAPPGEAQQAAAQQAAAQQAAAQQAAAQQAAKIESSLRYELANLCVTRGDLDRALALLKESLQGSEQIGDIEGKAASLHQMAQVYLTRGELDRTLALYQESLQLKEQIGCTRWPIPT